MKENITDQIRNIYDNGRQWLKLEIEYAKLTATEKISILLSTLILGAICILLGMVILILFPSRLSICSRLFYRRFWRICPWEES